MAKRVFFSFHYDDVISFRANVVRNHDLLKETGTAGFFDASIWEEAERHQTQGLKRLINESLANTSVTCVLIGSHTAERRWVRYEIMKSYDRRNKLFGVHINGIQDKNRQTFAQGADPFASLGLTINSAGEGRYHERSRVNREWIPYADLPASALTYERTSWGKGHALSEWVPCYDWVKDNGYKNFASWVENAK